MKSAQPGESSADIRKRINRARGLQLERYKERKRIYCNAHLEAKDIRNFCRIDDEAQNLLKIAIEKFGLSARAYDKILKVSRTIADLEDVSDIKINHVAEAIQYRSLDKDVWNKL